MHQHAGEAEALAAQVQDLQTQLEQQLQLVRQLEDDLLAAQQGGESAASQPLQQNVGLHMNDEEDSGVPFAPLCDMPRHVLLW